MISQSQFSHPFYTLFMYKSNHPASVPVLIGSFLLITLLSSDPERAWCESQISFIRHGVPVMSFCLSPSQKSQTRVAGGTWKRCRSSATCRACWRRSCCLMIWWPVWRSGARRRAAARPPVTYADKQAVRRPARRQSSWKSAASCPCTAWCRITLLKR